MTKVLGWLGGKKFIVALFGVIAVVAGGHGIAPETVYTIGGIVSSFLLGQGVADGMTGGATSSVAISNETVQPPK